MDPSGSTWWSGAWRRLAADPFLAFAWAGVLAAFVLTPDIQDRLSSPCLFRAATGLPCPGCGLSRSFVAAAHLDLPLAFSLHPFGPMLLAGAIVALAVRPAGRRLDLWVAEVWSTHRWARVAAFGIASAWLVWAVARAVTAARS